MEKAAILFVDGETIKIVIGKTLKCMHFSELSATHNIKFIEQLFGQAKVVSIDKVSPLDKNAFDTFVSKFQSAVSTPEKASVPPPVSPSKKSAATIREDAEEESIASFFRSLEETTIIVDDLPTGEDLPNLPGVKRMLAIHPNKAVNLSALPQEAIKNSAILKRLIREGKLIPCTRAEALAIESDYERKVREDNDARLDHMAPILTERAADYAAGLSSSGKLDIDAHDAETIDLTEDVSAPESDNEMSLTDIMQLAEDDSRTIFVAAEPAAPTPKRALAPRPKANTSGIKAKGIGRSK